MTEEEEEKRIEELFGVSHRLTYREVEFFIDVVLSLVGDNVDLLRVRNRSGLDCIQFCQSSDEESQTIVWRYDCSQVLEDGLVTEQSFTAKPGSDPWLKEVRFFSSIGWSNAKVGSNKVRVRASLRHREMQLVMKDVWNVYLVNRARAEQG